MKLSEYLNDRDVVVKLDGKVVNDLSAFKGLKRLVYGTSKDPRTVDVSPEGDFDMGDALAMQTSIGLLSVATVPGRRRSARTIEQSQPYSGQRYDNYRGGY